MSTEFFNDQWRIPSNENQNKVSNYSMEFDGTNTKIDFGNINNFERTDSFSFSLWINIPSYATNYYVSKQLSSAPFTGYNLFSSSNGKLQFLLNNTFSSNTLYVTSTSQIPQNQWVHLTLTYDGSSLPNGVNMYFNGVPEAIITVNDSLSASTLNTTDFQISGRGGGNGNIVGKVDQVTIFDYALSQDQVTQLGAEGYAFNFNGVLQSGDYIDCGIGSRFNLSQITISTWIKKNSSTINYAIAAGIRNNTGPIPYFISLSTAASNQIRFVMAQSDGTNITTFSNAIIENDIWYHVVGVADGSNVLIYVNGDLQTDQKTYDGTILTPNENFNIGRQAPSGGVYYWDGELSNISVFNTGLQDTDVQTLYNSGKPGNISSLNPIGWWKLDDTATFNSGTSVWSIPDASTNSNTGASFGMDASNLVASNIEGELIANPMITSPKPISYYQLGDQSVDNGANYLVPNNSLSDYVFNFDSNLNSLIQLAAPTITSVVTISAWIKKFPGIGSSAGVFGIRNLPTSPFKSPYRLCGSSAAASPKMTFTITQTNNTVKTTISATTQDIGVWYHVLGVADGTNATLYINGVQDGTPLAYDGTLLASNVPLFIGAQGTSGSLQPFDFNGHISNCALWDTNLSPTQVETIYNNGAPNDISSLSPTAWYKLNASEIFKSLAQWSVDNNAYPSVYQSSLDFTTNDYINCGSSSSLAINGDLTLSAWINIDANPGGFYGVISKRTSATVRNYEVLINSSGKVGIYVANGGVATGTVFDSVIPINTWVNIVITIQSGVANGAKLFLNGSQDAITGTQSISADAADFLIGARGPASSPSSYINGSISNVSIFNTALSTPNVQTLYNNGTPEASISHSPVSWWKLDNTTTGLIDNGSASNNGTNNGAAEYAGFVNALAGESSGMDSSNLVVSDLQQTSGYSPYALDFSGITASLKTYTIPAQTNIVTLSAWVKRTGASGNSAGVFGVRNSGGGATFGVCWDLAFLTTTNKIEFRIADTTYRTVTQNDVMPDNTWTHVAGVADGTNIKLYINGVLQTDTDTYSSNLLTPTSNIFFAAQGPAGSNPFNGQLSNCARWNIGLTQSEVTEIYNQGVPSNLNTFSGTAPIGWWQIGSNSSFEGDDWTCLDEIGTDYADSHSTAMANDDITDGPGYSASGLGSSTIDIVGDAPYSTANGLSENMDVLDRTIDVPG